MAISGRTFKACGCRDTTTGKSLGQKCPQLHRASGGWSRSHGTWNYQLELPPTRDGKRRSPLRRSGYPTQDAAENEMGQAVELLGIAGTDQAVRIQIADLIVATVKATKELPNPEEVRRKVRTGHKLDDDITTGEWLQQWLKGRKALRNGTRRAYASHINIHYLPLIGDIPLTKLRVTDVAGVFEAIDELNEIITQARTSGDPALRTRVKGRRVVSAATKQRIRATLRAALNQAIRERRLDLNVASLVELESGKRPKALVWTPGRVAEWRKAHDRYIHDVRQRQRNAYQAGSTRRRSMWVRPLDAYVGAQRPSKVMVWTPEHTGTFLTCARRHRLYAQYHLIAFRGLRRGESCGLRWADLDLSTGVMTIRWQITTATGCTEQGKPKSDAGDRQVMLDTHTITELKAHRARQNKERLAAGDTWHDTGFVFTTPTGEPLHPSEVSDQFLRLAMDAGLPPIRLHDLRHGAATFLLQAGHDMRVVQETLGLSSIAIAADTYTSVLPELARQSAEDAAAIIINATRNTNTSTDA